MSPTVTERIGLESEKTGGVVGGTGRGFYDTQLFSPVYGRSFMSRHGNSIRLLGGHERRYVLQGHTAAIRTGSHQLVTIRMAGSCLPDAKFASFDSTGVDTHRVSQWVADLALGVGPRSQGLIEIDFEHVDHEIVTGDFDEPLEGTWLVAAFDAIFAPVLEEDVELGFDPDDYPVT